MVTLNTKETNIVIGEILKRDDLKVVIAYKEYKYSSFIDLREYTKVGKEYLPTKQGFTLSILHDTDNVDELIVILSKVKGFLNDKESKKEKELEDARVQRANKSTEQSNPVQTKETNSSQLGLWRVYNY